MVEATAVSCEGRITPFDLGLWSDEHGRALEPIACFVRAQGAIAGVQLAHSGRKGSIDVPWRGERRLFPGERGWSPLGPSSLSFRSDEPAPRVLEPEDIRAIPLLFERAAGRALAAGFQVVEVHMAHGYLLHEFLSSLSNHRKDAWGGSWENRVRLPLEVAATVRRVWPKDLPVFVRISATDWVEGGWDLGQSIRLAAELKRMGIDLVDCSSGGIVPDAKVPDAVGYQVPFAAAVRQRAEISTGAVGRITGAAQAEEILASGQADVVFLGRELLRNPCWPLVAARELGVEVPWPNQYESAGR
jgi:2,4-dienoyl-CoA reductase-like NADH-dependent reductase (Old Yellow Enzyme family)